MTEEENSLRKQLQDKDREMTEIFGMFKEIKSSYESQHLQLDHLKTQIDTLKASLEMKDTQIQTLNSTLKMKDEQIKMTLTPGAGCHNLMYHRCPADINNQAGGTPAVHPNICFLRKGLFCLQ
jgi:predicted RNase H-like nuclease (RuvC/YqgF family)